MTIRTPAQYLSVQHAYASPLDRHRAGILLWMTGLLAAVSVVWAAVSAASVSAFWALAVPLMVLASGVFIFLNVRSGRLRRASMVLVALLLVIAALFVVFANTAPTTILGASVVLMIPVAAAAILLNWRVTLIAALLAGAVLVFAGSGQSQNTDPVTLAPADTAALDLITAGAALGIVAGLLAVFARTANRIARLSLEDIRQRQWVAEFAIDIGQTLLTDSVILARALALLRDRFGYTFAQVYRYDQDYAQLVRTISSGLGQQEAADRGGFSLGDLNAISECARVRQPVSTAEGAPNSAHLRPAMRSGVALPIVHAGTLLGVLDIQRTEAAPLPSTEVETLLLLAGNIGVGIANAQLAGDIQRHLDEQASVVTRLQEQLAEYHSQEQRRVGDAWGSYLQGRGKAAIGFDIGHDIVPVAAHDLPDSLRRALEQGAPFIETRGDEKIVHVPIRFRSQMLGAMVFHIPASQELTTRQVEMARIVSERLALALENMRLFEQSQAQALRERKAGQITGELIGAKDVRALLNLAASSFNEVLGAVHTRIVVQPDLLADAAPRREEAAP